MRSKFQVWRNKRRQLMPPFGLHTYRQTCTNTYTCIHVCPHTCEHAYIYNAHTHVDKSIFFLKFHSDWGLLGTVTLATEETNVGVSQVNMTESIKEKKRGLKMLVSWAQVLRSNPVCCWMNPLCLYLDSHGHLRIYTKPNLEVLIPEC